jgi:large subunit ribosomal protein L3
MIGFAKKIGMTRLFLDGASTAVTSIKFVDSFVLQKKTSDKEGYDSVQIGAFRKKAGDKAKMGHSKKYLDSEQVFGIISEFKVDSKDAKMFTAKDFEIGDLITITSKTKGLGFAGGVKRWGFAGQPASHGHDHKRSVGSIGAGGVQRVFQGKKMAGRKGADQLTLNGQKIVAVDYEQGLLFVKGSIPGGNRSVIKIEKN